MSRRVLLMVQQFTQGGSERQCAQMALGLAAAGYQVHAAAMRPGGMRAAELEAAGIPLTIFPVRSFASLDPWRAGLAFCRYLRRHRIEVVHAFDVPSNVFAVPWARMAGTPKVLASQRAHRSLTPPSLKPLEKISDRLAHGIVVNCQSVRQELTSGFGIPASRIHVVYNGIDSKEFSPNGAHASLPFPAGSVVIGSLCALRPEKDLDTLLQAFAIIAEDFPRAHLLLVGDGPERGRLEAQSLAGRTHFAGAQQDTASWYRAMDIFVLPSRNEALSNSLLEAISCGRLALASAVGGNPECFPPPADPHLFPPGEPHALAALLRKLLSSPENLRSTASSQYRYTLEKFSLGTAVCALESIYA